MESSSNHAKQSSNNNKEKSSQNGGLFELSKKTISEIISDDMRDYGLKLGARFYHTPIRPPAEINVDSCYSVESASSGWDGEQDVDEQNMDDEDYDEEDYMEDHGPSRDNFYSHRRVNCLDEEKFKKGVNTIGKWGVRWKKSRGEVKPRIRLNSRDFKMKKNKYRNSSKEKLNQEKYSGMDCNGDYSLGTSKSLRGWRKSPPMREGDDGGFPVADADTDFFKINDNTKAAEAKLELKDAAIQVEEISGVLAPVLQQMRRNSVTPRHGFGSFERSLSEGDTTPSGNIIPRVTSRIENIHDEDEVISDQSFGRVVQQMTKSLRVSSDSAYELLRKKNEVKITEQEAKTPDRKSRSISIDDEAVVSKALNLASSVASGPTGPSTPKRSGKRVTSITLPAPPPQSIFETQSSLPISDLGVDSSHEGTSKKVLFGECNDTLKVVFMGSPQTGKSSLVNALSSDEIKGSRKRKNTSSKAVKVNITEWKPFSDKKYKYSLWDLHAGSLETGSHFSTQALFFSTNTLYIIVWDLAVHNPQLSSMDDPRNLHADDFSTGSDSSEYESDMDDPVSIERRNAKRDRVIERDIDDNFIHWLDVVARYRTKGSAILPVVTFSDNFSNGNSLNEAFRRCEILKKKLLSHPLYHKRTRRPRILFDLNGNIPMISSKTRYGISELRQTIISLSTSHEVFDRHFHTIISPVIKEVCRALQQLRLEGFEIVHYEKFKLKVFENPPEVDILNKSILEEALEFLSSTGEVLYFAHTSSACSDPMILTEYIVLNVSWLSNAINYALRKDFQKTITELRHLSYDSVDNRRLYSKRSCFQQFSSCPIISADEIETVWQDAEYLSEQIELAENDGHHNLFTYLQQVCEHTGILVPIKLCDSRHYYLPSATKADSPKDFWSFKVRNSWKTTLCHTFVISQSMTISLMDEITVRILEELSNIESSKEDSMYVNQLICTKTSIYAMIEGEIRTDEGDKMRVQTEIFVSLVHSDSSICAGSDHMKSYERKLIVCGKGLEGLFGDRIWGMGFNDVVETVENTLRSHSHKAIIRRIVCPQCLLDYPPAEAHVWMRDEITTNICGDEMVCSNSHRVHPALLIGPHEDFDDGGSVATGLYSTHTSMSMLSMGTAQTSGTYATNDTSSQCPRKTVDEILPSVVLVGYWEKESKDGKRIDKISNVGTGFIADIEQNLIVSAAHIFFELHPKMKMKKDKLPIFDGVHNSVVIGIVPHGEVSAVWTYTADIIEKNLYSLDACILQLKTKFENPVSIGSMALAPTPERFVRTNELKNEGYEKLKMTSVIERDSHIRIFGYEQSGNGLYEPGSHIHSIPDFAKGFVTKQLSKPKESGKALGTFLPASEIVVSVNTIGGHSGGPCVNNDGQVLGIISRADSIEAQKCYLAPSGLIRSLLRRSQQRLSARSSHKHTM